MQQYECLGYHKMDFIKEIISQNTQWESGRIDFPRVGQAVIERDVFPELEREAKAKFITIIRGMRRVGKSVLARQLAKKMVEEGMDAKAIGWFEFDRAMGAGTEDMDAIIVHLISHGSRLVVLDEVQFVAGWQDVLKRHYDRSDVKFVVTGSSALEMDRRSSESLAGRFALVKAAPFSFPECLRMKGKAMPKSAYEAVQRHGEMVAECEEYIMRTAFPEAAALDEGGWKKYLKESVIEPVFYKDIPSVFPNAKPDALLRVLELLAGSAGGAFQHQSIANALSQSHPAISEAVEVLERSLLVKVAYNFTPSMMKQRRVAKKAVFQDNGMLSLLNPQITLGLLAENAAAAALGAEYFWRDGERHEVDIIIPEKKLALEVKYKDRILDEDMAGVRRFLDLHPEWKGAMITKSEEGPGRIPKVPLWKALSGMWQAGM